VKVYLLPIFLLAACDQDQQNQRTGGADRNDAEMQRDNRGVGDPMNRDDRATGNNPTVGNNPNALDPANDPNVQTDNPPFEQSEKAEDIKLTSDIRKAVLAADGLSMAADNVQIITRDGVVLLRGNVESQAEKDAIEKIAHSAAGVAQVQNQLVVKAPN
jgi:hypothetical protein